MISNQALYADQCTAQSEAKARDMAPFEGRAMTWQTVYESNHIPNTAPIRGKSYDLAIGLTLESTDYGYISSAKGYASPYKI